MNDATARARRFARHRRAREPRRDALHALARARAQRTLARRSGGGPRVAGRRPQRGRPAAGRAGRGVDPRRPPVVRQRCAPRGHRRCVARRDSRPLPSRVTCRATSRTRRPRTARCRRSRTPSRWVSRACCRSRKRERFPALGLLAPPPTFCHQSRRCVVGRRVLPSEAETRGAAHRVTVAAVFGYTVSTRPWSTLKTVPSIRSRSSSS